MPEQSKTLVQEDLDALDREILLQKKIKDSILDQRQPLNVVYTWEAPERVYEVRNRRWFIYVGGLGMVAIVLAALTNNFVLIFAIIALVLVYYTVNTIPPHIIKHQITNKGIYTLNTIFLWKNFLCFWVAKRSGQYLLHFEYKGRSTDTYYKRMIMLLGKGDLEKIVTAVVQHIDYLGPNEIDQSFLTSLAQGKYIPLLDVIGDSDILTKDPKDSPAVLKAAQHSKTLINPIKKAD
jgi:hypothetical protein